VTNGSLIGPGREGVRGCVAAANRSNLIETDWPRWPVRVRTRTIRLASWPEHEVIACRCTASTQEGAYWHAFSSVRPSVCPARGSTVATTDRMTRSVFSGQLSTALRHPTWRCSSPVCFNQAQASIGVCQPTRRSAIPSVYSWSEQRRH